MANTITMKDVFTLMNKHSNNKVDFNFKTIDRKGGDISISIWYDNTQFNSPNELYNYIIERYEGLRDYSDDKEFKEIELTPINTIHQGSATISTMEFTVGYINFKLELIMTKE